MDRVRNRVGHSVTAAVRICAGRASAGVRAGMVMQAMFCTFIELLSDGIVVQVDNVEGRLNVGDEHLAVLNFDAEFTFDCVMHVHAGLDIGKAAFVTPVRQEADRHALALLQAVRSSGRDRSS